MLIEFQGEQHYESVDYFGGDKKFKDQQRKDRIKRNFCKENNMPLLEIRYDDKDWESKIKEFLNISS